MKKCKLIAIVLLLVFAAGLIAGCRRDAGVTPAPATPAPPATPAAPAQPAQPADPTPDEVSPFYFTSPGGISYPLETDEMLTWWMPLNGILVAPNFSNFNDTYFAQFLYEETGVFVDFISPPIGGESEAFSLMVASMDLPDIIETMWTNFPGGPAAAVENGVIIGLNDIIPIYAPDLGMRLDENPHFARMVRTDDGIYYTFPAMALDDTVNTTAGLVVRWDWLDYLGMDKPETMDDWYHMLVAFRDDMGAEYPLSFAGWGNFRAHMRHSLVSAFGVNMEWFILDDQVVYGPYMPGFKDFLIEMARWGAEGLIDPNFATNDQATIDSLILNHQTGATALWLGSGLGRFLPALREQNPIYTLGPVRYPVLNRGDTPMFSSLLNPFNGTGASITTAASNPQLAAKLLNFGYTEVGRITWNFGRENISYYIGDSGLVYLTDTILNHPQGWGIGQAWAAFSRGVYPGPLYRIGRFLQIYYQFEEQVIGLEFFTDSNMRDHLIPPISPLPGEEASRFARIMSDVISHVDEFTLTAILGITDVEANWDSFIEEMRNMGIEEAIEIQNAALARYRLR